jgi:hypothetical protein
MMEDASFAMPWMYEKVRIIVDEQGVFFFLWNSPYTVNEIVTENTSLLSFGEIQSVYQKMAPIVLSDRYSFLLSEDDSRTWDVYITEVRLGLARVTEKNVGSSGLLVPAWDFFGYTKNNQEESDPDTANDTYSAQLAINAIDGSVIDRSLGY